jgi:crotonobetainyl-CoA:carnitine CoA-transferase CaiB-like acyl-CoA transferase
VSFISDEEEVMTQKSSLPLARYKLLDLTHHRAGPTCVRQLVDWGVQAIKIEAPGSHGDDGMGGRRHGFDFQHLHRGKKGITLNLKKAEGMEIFKRLVKDADIVAENFRPRVKTRLGIDYQTLHAINPRLVYGSISAFGQTGPYEERPGVDQVIQGMSGLMSVTGIPGQGPVRVGIPIADICTGMFLAQGILVALLEREASGEGKWVHTSLMESMLSMMDFQAVRWLMNGQVAKQVGNGHPTGVATGLFETKDGYINIAAAGDVMFERFCGAVHRDDLMRDPRFSNAKARAENGGRTIEIITEITRQKTSAEWMTLLDEAEVPSGPVLNMDQTFADPQVRHLDMGRSVHSPVLGDITLLGHPVSIDNQRPSIACAAPEPGQDNEEILTSIGYTTQQIADLAQRGVI